MQKGNVAADFGAQFGGGGMASPNLGGAQGLDASGQN